MFKQLPRSLEGIDCKKISMLYKDKVTLRAMSPQSYHHLELNLYKHKVHFRCEPYIAQSGSKLPSIMGQGLGWYPV